MKQIQVRNERYMTLFTVPDGDSIIINGKAYRLEYIDETHFHTIGPSGGKECWHIDQFGEKVACSGRNIIEYSPEGGPVEECFTYFIDGTKGWIEVSRDLLKELCLLWQISNSSHQKDGLVYLADRGDGSHFRSAMESRGRRVKLVEARQEIPPILTYEFFNRHEDGRE